MKVGHVEIIINKLGSTSIIKLSIKYTIYFAISTLKRKQYPGELTIYSFRNAVILFFPLKKKWNPTSL